MGDPGRELVARVGLWLLTGGSDQLEGSTDMGFEPMADRERARWRSRLLQRVASNAAGHSCAHIWDECPARLEDVLVVEPCCA